ncbi:MAG: BON domain-containing protein [Nitrospiraceae bacterium]
MKPLTASLVVPMIIATAGFLDPAFVSAQPLTTPIETMPATSAPADNTEKNVRDQDHSTLTPIDQAQGSKHDVDMTRRIRKSLMADKTLSTNAQNIKIMTLNGKATLRGPVKNAGERERILKKAGKVVGVKNVESNLEVTGP